VTSKRLQPAFWVTVACALLMLSAQALTQAHVHTGVDEASWLTCSDCVLAKHQLTPAVDAASSSRPLIIPAPPPYDAPAEALTDSSTSQFRARAPPAA
jgi:hypothetical protein